MGIGLFAFGSFGAAFLASCIFHAFLFSTRWKMVAAVALLPCLVLFATSSASPDSLALIYGFSLAGSALGTVAAAGLRVLQNRLGF